MPDPQEPSPNHSPIAARTFPRRCRQCGKEEVVLATTEYDAEVRHDGHLHAFRIPKLKLPVCQACGARVFTEHVDTQIDTALRELLDNGEPKSVDLPSLKSPRIRRFPHPAATASDLPKGR